MLRIMKKTLFIACILCCFNVLNAQVFFNIGAGVSRSKADLSGLQKSYDSYKTLIKNTFPNDPFTDNGNWKDNQNSTNFMIYGGANVEGLYVGFGWNRNVFRQSKELIRNSGYGRRFDWQENRNDFLIDMGYGSEKFSIFATGGSNISKYSISSYQVYPDGSISIGSEFNNNGLFKGDDAGFLYGLGAQFRIKQRLVLELRYYAATDKFFGGPDEFLAYADNSFSRTPGTSQYPADYTQPLNLNNELLVGVKRSYLQFSVLFNILPQSLID